MLRKPVTSSNVKSVGYDEATKTLEVEFKSGGIYVYSNVPEQAYKGLISASSVGGYLDTHVKNVYPFRQIS